ncbi:MAG: sigma-54-dependent Fis family transcriptional regulator [Planctomycetes bacterium]|nr:sigma-54-dependent Fis family transcriptional regulator [Planctomycetota bacterium]
MPVGCSPPMQRLRETVESVARRSCTVIIRGESGSGKEMVARYMHAGSPRRDGPFVAVDCTTLKDTLFESQLFGHRKGAFTGADFATLGFIRSADGGTLVLDEIGEMALPIQAKLLRCIQDRAVVPLGETAPVSVDIRIIAATHRDLRAMVRRGEFREDLYFRLNVVQIVVPPLRERRSDIALLARHFLDHYAALYDEPAKTLTPDALRAIEEYAWPGNVRELANMMEQVHILAAGDEVMVDDLPEELRPAAARAGLLEQSDREIPTLEVSERMLIARALQVARGNRTHAAEILQIDRRRLRRKIRLYGLHALLKQPATTPSQVER